MHEITPMKRLEELQNLIDDLEASIVREQHLLSELYEELASVRKDLGEEW